MKILFLIVTATCSLVAMDNPEHPRYHINNKVMYLRETRESGDGEYKTVSDFNKSLSEVPLSDKPQDVAIIDTGMSNKTKVILAGITATSAITTALISALVTYYTTSCNK